MALKSIGLKRFNALAAHSRSPAAAFISEELDWFSNDDESLIATLMRDTEDGDFVGIILGRDQSGRYRCIDCLNGHETPEQAVTWIDRAIAWHGRDARGRLNFCVRSLGDLSTAAGVACDERPARWASRWCHATRPS
jgi:hypothetical protein